MSCLFAVYQRKALSPNPIDGIKSPRSKQPISFRRRDQIVGDIKFIRCSRMARIRIIHSWPWPWPCCCFFSAGIIQTVSWYRIAMTILAVGDVRSSRRNPRHIKEPKNIEVLQLIWRQVPRHRHLREQMAPASSTSTSTRSTGGNATDRRRTRLSRNQKIQIKRTATHIS